MSDEAALLLLNDLLAESMEGAAYLDDMIQSVLAGHKKGECFLALALCLRRSVSEMPVEQSAAITNAVRLFVDAIEPREYERLIMRARGAAARAARH